VLLPVPEAGGEWLRSDPTYNDTRDASGGVAAFLEVLRHDGEYARGQSHVEQSVGLFPPGLELLEVLVQLQEGLVAVILARDICADGAELLELLLDILGRRLDVRLDPTKVLVVVHLGARIADNSDVLGQELVSVLHRRSAIHSFGVAARRGTYEAKESGILDSMR